MDPGTVDPAVKSTIEKLDQRIAKLERKIGRLRVTKETLLEEFSGDDTAVHSDQNQSFKEPPVTRKQQVVAFLLSNGAAPRKDIVSGTGMPVGSVSDVLRDKKTFRQVPGGRWDVQEHLKADKQ